MCSAELVDGLIVHLLGESRQGCVSDVIHPGPPKHLHDLLTRIGHEGTTPLTDTGSGLARAMLETCGSAGKGVYLPGVRVESQAMTGVGAPAGKVQPDAHRSPWRRR